MNLDEETAATGERGDQTLISSVPGGVGEEICENLLEPIAVDDCYETRLNLNGDTVTVNLGRPQGALNGICEIMFRNLQLHSV